jgi:hypothetical protein
VSQVAEKQDIGKGAVAPNYLNDQLDKTVPVFTLTNFEAGPLADIASRPWKDFVSPESSATEVLGAGTSNRYYSDNGHQVVWTDQHVYWTPVVRQPDVSAEAAMKSSRSTVIALESLLVGR